MAVPEKGKRLKKRVKKRQSEELGLGEGPSGGTSKKVELGELINPLLEQLDFAPATVESEKHRDAAAALLSANVPELRISLKQLTQRLGSLRTAAGSVAQHLAGQKGGTNGAPAGSAAYMDMKNQLLLSYLVGLTYYLLLKARGAPVRDHPVALRLMWLRTLLEKLKPVDQRLQYQMNKLLQAAEAKPDLSKDKAVDPRAMRPGELATTVDDEDDDDEGEEPDRRNSNEDEDGIYRPPRIAQVEYTGDHVSSKEKAERDFERQKRRFDNSDMMRSLREEFTDAPAEIHGEQRSNAHDKAHRKMMEQEEYEAENMVRLRSTRDEKKEKQRLFRAKRSGGTGGIVSLEDAMDTNDIAAALEGASSRGPKGKGKGKRSGGSALQNFQGAQKRMSDARNVVDSVEGGRMPEGLGAFKRGRGGGGDKGGGKGDKGGGKKGKRK